MDDKDKRGKRMKDLLELVASMPKIEEPNYSWAIHKLEEEFPGLKLDRVYGMFPTQAEGKFQGMGVYARYRWDVFSITMGEQGENKILPQQDYYYESEGFIDDGDGGFLTPEAFYKEFQKGFSKILSQI